MIKWYGKNTQGNIKWSFSVSTLSELYNVLVSKDIITMYDYNPFERYIIERAGYSYSEIEREACELADEELSGDYSLALERILKEKNISDSMTDHDYYMLIISENGNAFYQRFEDENGNEISF